MNRFFVASILAVIFLNIVSCRKEWSDFDTSSSVELSFSADTVRFDTVFTTIPTVTKWILVRNNSKKYIKISRVYLENGSSSAFRLNVDGDTSLTSHDVIVASRDSFYIFITADLHYLQNINTPFEVLDNIVFELNGNKQQVVLQAWGQNAYYHFPNMVHKIPLIEGDTQYMHYFEWDCDNATPVDKPHVFFGHAAVAQGKSWTIPSGAKLYFAGGAGVWVKQGGVLDVQGTFTNPVLFTSLRQDYDYKTMPGQWSGIWIDAGSDGNQINYANIFNAQYGVMIDSSTTSNNALEIYNTRIENMTRYGILSQKNYIKGVNIVVGNCATGVGLLRGGGATFFHCTFTNYYSSFGGAYSLVLNDYSGEQTEPFAFADFINCIIYGKTDDQINFDLKEKTNLPYLFDHCIVGTSVKNNKFVSCSSNDPVFTKESEGNYEISSEKSPAVKAGNTTYSDPMAYRDIKNILRGTPPTIGAYEFVKQVNP
ncbi:MAG: hypothetical protein LBQ31_01745 [Bacteroidales bacterium]|jgi:hypothetical protein|nr:hypothetical protein [Bacteroidales bacterium]